MNLANLSTKLLEINATDIKIYSKDLSEFKVSFTCEDISFTMHDLGLDRFSLHVYLNEDREVYRTSIYGLDYLFSQLRPVIDAVKSNSDYPPCIRGRLLGWFR